MTRWPWNAGTGYQALLQDDLTGSLYELLTGKYGLTSARARQEIGAGPCSCREARQLGMAEGAAILLLERAVRDRSQRPFEYVESVCGSDRCSFVAKLIGSSERPEQG